MNAQTLTLEAQLAGVLEQDGLTMVSPEGIRRRAKRMKPRRDGRPAAAIFFDREVKPTPSHDDIVELDQRAIEFLTSGSDDVIEHIITIRQEAVERSAYVLSLREVMTSSSVERVEQRERLPDAMVHEQAGGVSREGSVYATLLHDLVLEGYEPHVFTEQFTAETFDQASRHVFGVFARTQQALHAVWSDFLSLIQRVERTEARVAGEVAETIQVIETPRLVPLRAIAGLAALVLLVTLPAQAVVVARSALKTRVVAESAGNDALNDLKASASSANLSGSIQALGRASSRFREADELLTQSRALAVGLAAVVPEKYRTARALMELGDKSSEAATLLATGFDKVFSDPERHLDERLDVLAAYSRGVLPLLSDATKAAGTVNIKDLPEGEARSSFAALSERLEQSTTAVREFAALADFLSVAAGKNMSRRYLVIFQNQTELRPTGGFMGSLADVTVDRGEMRKLIVPSGGTYDLKGQLLANVISPKPLQLINPRWQFQDANWSPDFPTAAKKIQWFWSKAGQPTVDGVIAINASVVERLLDVTGPIEMPTYGKVIDRNNFFIETQKAVELEYDREANTPKKFVGDLAAVMFERLKHLEKDQMIAIVGILSESLATKDVQVAMTNPEEEEIVERFGWNGRIKPTTGDSLAVIEANVAGQKTDGVVDEQVQHTATVQNDGSIIDTVTIQRTHRGAKGELFRGVRNVSYIRLFVPEGSRLLEASGFEAPADALFKVPDDVSVPDHEILASERVVQSVGGVVVGSDVGRTVFGGWAQVDPGETQVLTYRYRLPWTVQDLAAQIRPATEPRDVNARSAYSLLLTSQSGKRNRTIQSSLVIPPTWEMMWSRGATSTSTGISFASTWDRDMVVSALMRDDRIEPTP